MVKHSNRNGGRPAMLPERRRIRITITLPPEDVQVLAQIDENRSAAVRNLIREYTAAAHGAKRTAKETK